MFYHMARYFISVCHVCLCLPLHLAHNSRDSALLPSILLGWLSHPISFCPAIGQSALYQPMRVMHIYSVQRLSHSRGVSLGNANSYSLESCSLLASSGRGGPWDFSPFFSGLSTIGIAQVLFRQPCC